MKCVLMQIRVILRKYLLSSVQGGNEDLFLRSNSVCFWLSYSLRNDSIQGFQSLEEREVGKLTRLQSQRPKNILWKSQKEPVENDDNTWYDTIGLITSVIVLPQKLIIGWFPSLFFNTNIVLGDESIITSHLTL